MFLLTIAAVSALPAIADIEIKNTTSEAINKSTIIAIILLILRSFQKRGLCNSSLKTKSTTFAYNNTFKVTIVTLK